MMSCCSGSVVRGLIKKSSLNFSCSAVNKIWNENFGIKYCYKSELFSTSPINFKDKKNEEDDPCKAKDIYKVSPLCAPKGYKFKGEIVSLKCPPKCESTANAGPDQQNSSAQLKPGQEKPSAEQKSSVQQTFGQAAHKSQGPAESTPLLDGIAPVKRDPKEANEKVSKSPSETKLNKVKSFCKKLVGSDKKKDSKKKKKENLTSQGQKSQSAASPKSTADLSPSPKSTAAPSPSPKPNAAPSPSPKTTAAPSPSPKPTAAPSPSPKPTAAPSPSPKSNSTPSTSPTSTSAPSSSPVDKCDTSDTSSTSPAPTSAKSNSPESTKDNSPGQTSSSVESPPLKSTKPSGIVPPSPQASTPDATKKPKDGLLTPKCASVTSPLGPRNKCSSAKVVLPKTLCPPDPDSNPEEESNSQYCSDKNSSSTDLKKPLSHSDKSEQKSEKKNQDKTEDASSPKGNASSKSKSSQDSDSDSKPPTKPHCIKTRKDLNAKCPDPNAFEPKSKVDEPDIKEAPCSVLPWPFNILDNKRKQRKLKKEKVKKEKCKQQKKKKKEAKKKLKIVSVLEHQTPRLVLPLNLQEALFKNAWSIAKCFHTNNFKNSSGPSCPLKELKKCDDLVKNEKMEDAMKKLRAAARNENTSMRPNTAKICMYPPGVWERLACGLSLEVDKKNKKDNKDYDVPRFPGRKLRKKRVC